MNSTDTSHDRDERLSRLLDLAYEDASGAIVPAEDSEELHELVVLLQQIDAAWTPDVEVNTRVRALFLQRLAAKDPAHPWVRASTVHTLGELIAGGGEDIPAIPAASYTRLVTDTTPVESLLDRQQRTKVVGQALRNAAVPPALIGDFLLWFNRLVITLIPQPGPETRGFLFTRRQRGIPRDRANGEG